MRVVFSSNARYRFSQINKIFDLIVENSCVNVTDEITKQAKLVDPDIKVIILPIDPENSRLKRVDVALQEAIRSGYWILIENAHLITEWPIELLKILYVSEFNLQVKL